MENIRCKYTTYVQFVTGQSKVMSGLIAHLLNTQVIDRYNQLYN